MPDAAERDFAIGENAFEKRLAMSPDGGCEAFHFHEVDADAHDLHLRSEI
jgi:hypothetical protein